MAPPASTCSDPSSVARRAGGGSAGKAAALSAGTPFRASNRQATTGVHAGRCKEAAFKPHHAISVPRSLNLEDAYQTCGKQITTAMLRNIPNRYSQANLLQEIDAAGFEGTYNFFYLPMDTHNKANVGYAFINFVDQSYMDQFIEIFSGYKFKDHWSQKIARVSPAHIQGFAENVQHFSNRAVTHSRNTQYRPLILNAGPQTDLSEAGYAYPAGAYHDAAADMSPLYSAQQLPGAVVSSPFNPDAAEFVPSFSATYAAAAAAAGTAAMEGERSPAEYSPVEYSPAEYSPVEYSPAEVPTPSQEDIASTNTPEKQSPFGTADLHDSWSSAKRGLEGAVSKWLQETKVLDTASTDGANSCTASSSASPRSTSPTVLAGSKAEVPVMLISSCPPGLEPPPGLWELETPRTNRTFSSIHGGGC